jgi:citrate lyase subunit beta/citryl-CoA lyase
MSRFCATSASRLEQPVWRSLLYVPVTSERFVASALGRRADALILDLEDSIPLSEKSAARVALPGAVKTLQGCASDLIVRVNSPWRLLLADLEAAVIPGVGTLCLPKAQSAEHVRMVAQVMTELELERGIAPGTISLLPLIETVEALGKVREIAQADPRVVAISLGDEDFCTSAGIEPSLLTLQMPKQQVVFAAREAGILALGYLDSLASYTDLSGFTALLVQARQFGFAGAPCVHPSQISMLNQAFTPDARSAQFAQRVVEGYRQALENGQAAFALDGRMIDGPALQRAEALLMLARKIAAKEAANV